MNFMHSGFDLGSGLGGNASVPYATVRSSGPPSRPLEFPSPTVDNGVTVSADIVDHRTGHPFRATSVLMRRPVHARTCPACNPPAIRGAASFECLGKSGSPDMIHSWRPAFNAPSSSLAPDSTNKPRRHRRVRSHSPGGRRLPPCGPACELPERAYCVVRKIRDTAHGSVRLCVVLRRVSRDAAPLRRRRDAGLAPEWETTDERVTVKVVGRKRLRSPRSRHPEDPIAELAALQQLLGGYHPNVVSILDALQDETHLFCVFPFFEGGDLRGRLRESMASSPTGRIDEALARAWFRQMVSAINHLQKKGVCHRDICLENMAVAEDGSIRLIDFGLCLRVPFADPDNRSLATDVSANTVRRLIRARGQCGRLECMAPEVSARSECFDGFAVDLWAAGIALFELLVGSRPFAVPSPADANFEVVSVEGNLVGLLRSKGIGVSDGAVDLLQGMLWCDPAKRLTLSEIVCHPWVQGGRDWGAAPVEEVGMDRGWFVRISSIDESADLSLSGLLDDSCRGLSTVESLASTAATTDAELQSLRSQVSSELPPPMDRSHLHPSPSPEPRGQGGVDEIHAQRKRKWPAFRLRRWCPKKARSTV